MAQSVYDLEILTKNEIRLLAWTGFLKQFFGWLNWQMRDVFFCWLTNRQGLKIRSSEQEKKHKILQDERSRDVPTTFVCEVGLSGVWCSQFPEFSHIHGESGMTGALEVSIFPSHNQWSIQTHTIHVCYVFTRFAIKKTPIHVGNRTVAKERSTCPLSVQV